MWVQIQPGTRCRCPRGLDAWGRRHENCSAWWQRNWSPREGLERREQASEPVLCGEATKRARWRHRGLDGAFLDRAAHGRALLTFRKGRLVCANPDPRARAHRCPSTRLSLCARAAPCSTTSLPHRFYASTDPRSTASTRRVFTDRRSPVTFDLRVRPHARPPRVRASTLPHLHPTVPPWMDTSTCLRPP